MRKPLSLVVLAIFSFSACNSREEPRMTKMLDVNQAIAALRDASINALAVSEREKTVAIASPPERMKPPEPCGGGSTPPLSHTGRLEEAF